MSSSFYVVCLNYAYKKEKKEKIKIEKEKIIELLAIYNIIFSFFPFFPLK